MKKAIKKIFLVLGVAVSAITIGRAASPNDTTVYFRLDPPMHCHNCENRIKNDIRFEKGVRAIEASAADSLVTIKFDKRKTDTGKLTDALGRLGYEATPATK